MLLDVPLLSLRRNVDDNNNGEFDPFGTSEAPESGRNDADGAPAGEPKTPPEPPRRKKKRRLSSGRKIAYAAVGTAIAVVMMVLTCYLPITVAPLVMISLCYNIVSDKCGLGYGIMTILASVGLGFLCCMGNLGVMLVVVVVFVPYSLLCLPLKRLDYSSLKKAFIRIAVIAVFAALAVLFVFLLGANVAGYIDLGALMSDIGGSFAIGYIVVTLAAIILFVCVDLLFINVGKQIVRKLK